MVVEDEEQCAGGRQRERCRPLGAQGPLGRAKRSKCSIAPRCARGPRLTQNIGLRQLQSPMRWPTRRLATPTPGMSAMS